MAITRVGTDASNSGTTSPLTSTYPTGIAAGDLIISSVVVNANGTVTTPTGYTLIDSQVIGSSNQANLYVFGRIADGTEGASYSITFATATRIASATSVRRADTLWNATVAKNFQPRVKNGASAATSLAGTAMTGVPSGAWLFVAAGSDRSGTAPTVSLTGTHWTQAATATAGGSSICASIEVGDNTTDTGTANAPTASYSSAQDNISMIQFFLVEVYVLVGGGATWTWTGAAASVLFKHLLVGVGGVWSWTGAAASLLYKRLLVGTGGVWSWAGNAAKLLYKRLLVGTGAVWSWTGAAASLLYKRLLVAAGAVWSWTGGAMYRIRIFVLGGATWAWTGAHGAFIKFCLGVQEAIRGIDGIVQSSLRSAGTASQELQRSAATTEEEVLRPPEASC